MILSEVEGIIQASNSLTTFTTITRSYVLLYFNLGNQLVDGIAYRRLVGSLDRRPPLIFAATPNSALIPKAIFLGGDAAGIVAYYDLNSFITSDSTCASKTRLQNLCMSCVGSEKFLNHKCQATCPYGAVAKGDHCALCNRKCKTCANDRLSTCDTCNDDRELAPACTCKSSAGFDNKGTCKEKCDKGYRALHQGTCMRKCPGSYLMINEWVNETYTADKTAETKINSPTYVMEFQADSKGIKIPVPGSLTADTFPKAFTMTMWVNAKAWRSTTQYLVRAFGGHINIFRAEKVVGTKISYPRARVGGNEATTTSVDETLRQILALNETTWCFIALTKQTLKNKEGNNIIEMYLVSQNKNDTDIPPPKPNATNPHIVGSVTPAANRLDVAAVNIKNFIVIGGDYNETSDELLTNTSFDGYIREFKIVTRFMSVPNLLYQKYHSHTDNWPELLAYWRLDEAPEGTVANLKDKSSYSQTCQIPSVVTSYPRMVTTPTDLVLELYSWEELFTCWNPLANSKSIPNMVGSAQVYDAMTSESNKQLFSFITGNDIRLSTGDSIFVSESDCFSSALKIVAKKDALYQDKIMTWSVKKSFDSVVPGKPYALCYTSAQFLTTQHLSWIYVSQRPETIEPKVKLLYTQFETKIQISGIGGDDGNDNKIYIAKSEQAILDNAVKMYSSVKKTQTGYEEFDFTDLDPGFYFAFWSPYYSDTYKYFVRIPGVIYKKVDQAQIYFRIFNL